MDAWSVHLCVTVYWSACTHVLWELTYPLTFKYACLYGVQVWMHI